MVGIPLELLKGLEDVVEVRRRLVPPGEPPTRPSWMAKGRGCAPASTAAARSAAKMKRL